MREPYGLGFHSFTDELNARDPADAVTYRMCTACTGDACVWPANAVDGLCVFCRIAMNTNAPATPARI